MGKVRFTTEQLIRKLREAEVLHTKRVNLFQDYTSVINPKLI